MNDILPKPFTKEGLLGMLEVCSSYRAFSLAGPILIVVLCGQKHLMHLKVIQQLARPRVPRSVGIPPLSDPSFEQAMASAVQPIANNGGMPSSSNNGDDDGKINIFAGMGLSDDQYNMILQSYVGGDVELMGQMGMPPQMGNLMSSMAMMGMMTGGMSPGGGAGGGGGGEKRGLDDAEDDREGKRGRFEVLE